MMALLGQTDLWAGIDVGEHLFLFSPMIVLVCTMLAVVACPIILGRGPRSIATVVWLGLGITLFMTFRVAGAVADGGVSGLSTQPGGMLIADNLSVGFQFLLLAFLAGVMLMWWMGSSATERNAPEFFILLLGSALGMVLMVSTTNLLMIVMAIELASLPSYAIVGFEKRNRVAAEASLKYMIFGAVCAAIMLYGASLLYGLVGSLDMAVIASYTIDNLSLGPNRVLLAVGLLCFLVGIAFKVSAVPFHFWCPDAFEGARIEVTTWLSVVSKGAGLLLLARLVTVFCAGGGADANPALSITFLTPLAWTIGIIAAVTCTVGNFAAYKQRSVKRMLAYSSIAHAGYMMMATAVFIHPSISGSTAGITALLTYVVIYLLMNLGAFGVTAMVVWDTGSDKIEAFTGLMRRSPWLAVPMVACLMSLVGMPPFAGFIGKWWILVALGRLQNTATSSGMFSLSTLGWLLMIVAVVNTFISLYYYLRIVVQMMFRDDGQRTVRTPIVGLAMVNGCAVALFALLIFAQPLKRTAERFTRNMYTASVEQDGKHKTLASAIQRGTP